MKVDDLDIQDLEQVAGEVRRAVVAAREGLVDPELIADIVTVWDRHGRIVAADLAEPRLRTSLRTRI